MRPVQKLIVFLNFFGTGLLVPVLSLFLLAHGTNLPGLSILIGIYSVVVILAEVPSGLFADMYGRRTCFFLSAAFTAVGLVLLYVSQSLALLFPGMILFGLGGAFLSGSLDSLIIEDSLARNGESALSRTASANLLYQSAGLSAGALAGGLLPNFNGYLLHILARLGVLAIVVLLCALFVEEARPYSKEQPSLGGQLKKVAYAIQGRGQLKIVLLCIFGSSMTLFAIETYWQPRFTELITQPQHYLLGVLSALAYGGSLLGSFLNGRLPLREQGKRWRSYLIFITLFGAALWTLSVQTSVPGFMLSHILALTLLGAANVPEQTLLNSLADRETRASLLSVGSLFSKLAGISGSAVCTVLILPTGIRGVWLVTGGLTIVVAIMAAIILKRMDQAAEQEDAHPLSRTS